MPKAKSFRSLLRALTIFSGWVCVSPGWASMQLGVNAHFEQGWPLAAFAQVKDAGAQGIRETVTWGKVEQRPGYYDFSAKNSGHVGYACRRGVSVLLVVAPRNKIYDGGMAVSSPAGRSALGNYVGALIDRFPCIIGIEIGNEINTASPKWLGSAEKPAMYVAMLKQVRKAIDARKSSVALLGGSSIGVAVDFHERLFAAGELPLIDAVSVHPYIKAPERLPEQFVRLKQAMARHGQVKQIWCTEFGFYYKTPKAAPPHALKVMTIMSAAHVSRAYWYALLDQPWFPNMGLYARNTPKPALATFRLALQHLLAGGDARRIDARDPQTFIYRFGQGPYVMWGNGRKIDIASDVQIFDAEGRKIAAPSELGPAPIVLSANANYKLR